MQGNQKDGKAGTCAHGSAQSEYVEGTQIVSFPSILNFCFVYLLNNLFMIIQD